MAEGEKRKLEKKSGQSKKGESDIVFKYDIALSFSGEERDYVEKVAEELKQLGVTYFYDKDKEIESWGKPIPEYLHDVYGSGKSKHTVVFLSQSYTQKSFPLHELKSAQVQELIKSDYILPVKMEEGVDLSGSILPTKSYLNAQNLSPKDLAQIIAEKVNEKKSDKIDNKKPKKIKLPNIPKKDLNPYQINENFFISLNNKLEDRFKKLEEKGLQTFVKKGDEKSIFRVSSEGKAIYALNIRVGGLHNDKGISFSFDQMNSNSINAFGEIVWNEDLKESVIDLTNLSLLEYTGSNKQYTLNQFLDALWDQIIIRIEERF